MCPSLKTARERSDTDSLMDDQTAGVDNTHVGVPVSGGKARDGLTACRPPVSCQSPRLSLGGARLRLQQAGDDTLYLVELAAKPGIQLHPSVDFYR